MKVTNQKPVVLSPIYTDIIGKDFDPIGLLESDIVTQLYTPLVPSQPVSFRANKKTVTPKYVAKRLTDCCRDTIDIAAEAECKSILGQTLLNFDPQTNININELFAVQSGTAANLPEPTNKVIYTPSSDIIPSARRFIAGTGDFDTFFASLAYYARPNTLGFYFVNEISFDDFKAWVSTQMGMLGNVLDPKVNKLMADFQKLQLSNLTESLRLRANDTDGQEPNSFARLLTYLLMSYTKQVSVSEFGVLPFSLDELMCPKSVIFVNVERHAKATAKQISDEWTLIRTSLQDKPKMISNQQLSKLTAAQRNLQRIASSANTAAMQQNQIAKAAIMRFSRKEPTTVDVTRCVKKIAQKMSNVNKSMNVYKTTKISYQRPNRRNPDDPNKPGKMTRTNYKPDLHAYVDTSGSITEADYEDSIKALIAMAKAMNVNIYFNSFSDILSQTTLLRLKDKSKNAIYREFQKVPKVTGGTDFAQIWHFINRSKKRTRELSIIITDFCYSAPKEYIKHPNNLYYIPCSNQDWKYILEWADRFAHTALHNDPNIRKHILF